MEQLSSSFSRDCTAHAHWDQAMERLCMSAEQWPAESLEVVPTCPICGSAARTLIHQALTDNAFRVAPGNWRMWRCEDCGSGFLDPRPTQNSISKAYETYYTHATHTISRGGRLKQGILSAAYGYLNARYGLSLTPASRIGGCLTYLLPPFRGFLDGKLRHLPRPSSSSMLLDLGCGHGDFLAFARQAGWQALGLDFDIRAVAAARARGIEVMHGGLEVLGDDARDRYDYITLSHVIEHVYHPVETLRQVHRLLRPGGLAWIETPNIDALGHRHFGRHWRGLEAPRHLVLFSVRAMKQSLRDAGFERVRLRYRGPMVPLLHAEGQAFSEGLAMGSIPPWRQRLWPCVRDTLLEEIQPAKREFITVTAWKPA